MQLACASGARRGSRLRGDERFPKTTTQQRRRPALFALDVGPRLHTDPIRRNSLLIRSDRASCNGISRPLLCRICRADRCLASRLLKGRLGWACNRNTMPVPVQGAYQRGPSCWDRVKMGFTIGFCVGMASGALFGGFSALRYGLRGRELIQSVGKVMLQGGGTFGTFMSIGTAIRC